MTQSISPDGQAVLDAILSFGTSEERELTSVRCQSPGGVALREFCELIATKPKEEELQQFLAANPGFLMGLLATNDGGDLALVLKPKIGTKYVADFAIVQFEQGGAAIILVEIESSHESLFTKALGPAKRLQCALTQIDEWREWIEPNKLTFTRDMIDRAKSLDMYEPEKPNKSGYRFCDSEELVNLWNSFGGNEQPFIHYVIVIGRWSQLSTEEKTRFISKWRTAHDLSVFTYEQLARQANSRSERGY